MATAARDAMTDAGAPAQRTFRRVAWIAAALVAALFCASYAYRITDGDSCNYGSLGRDMAAGTWRTWVAPQWAFHGAMDCFHEHPPGAFWATAAVVLTGVPAGQAPLVANALWALLATAGTVALTRRLGGSPGAALAAGAVLLLHVAPLRFVQRGALEFPLVACSVVAVLAALRLRDARWWTAVLAVSLAGAFLTRGVFAFAAVGVLAVIALDPALRPPLARLLAGVAGAALLLIAFDRLHAAATGHGFWGAHLTRQVLPSFEDAGTRHSEPGLAAGYIVQRAFVYSLPWSILPIIRLYRRWRYGEPLGNASAWRLAAVWFALAVAGPALTSRPSARYLFQDCAPAAVLFGMALPLQFAGRFAPAASWAVPFLVPVLAIGKSVIQPRDDAWRTAELLDRFAAVRIARGEPARPVRGPFLPDEDSRRFFLRFHLGAEVFADLPDAPRDADLWVPAGRPVPPGARTLVQTPRGTLVAP